MQSMLFLRKNSMKFSNNSSFCQLELVFIAKKRPKINPDFTRFTSKNWKGPGLPWPPLTSPFKIVLLLLKQVHLERLWPRPSTVNTTSTSFPQPPETPAG